jgi:hypothetical protein
MTPACMLALTEKTAPLRTAGRSLLLSVWMVRLPTRCRFIRMRSEQEIRDGEARGSIHLHRQLISRAAGSCVLDEGALTARAKLSQDIEQGKVLPASPTPARSGAGNDRRRVHELQHRNDGPARVRSR